MMQDGAQVPYAYTGDGYMNCGPTSLCMVASDLLGMEFTPSALLLLGEKYNINVRPQESGDGIFRNEELLALIGIKLDNDGNKPIYGYDNIQQAMADDDKLIIANSQHSIFTDGGHYIVLSGYEDNGKVHVDDPNYYNYYDNAGNPNSKLEQYINGFDEETIKTNTGGYYIFSKAEGGLSKEELQQIVNEANNAYPAQKECEQNYFGYTQELLETNEK